MKRSIARKWAKALESGDYKQGKGKLRKGDSFCCLGLLCNLHAEANPEVAVTQKKKTVYLEEEYYLPKQVQDWSGMRSSHGELPKFAYVGKGGYDNLAALNDGAKLTFPEIAKVIRKHWKEL